MHMSSSLCILPGGFCMAFPSDVLGSLQMAGKIRRSFSHDQFEKWSDNMCRSLLMWQSTFLCNQFGNNHTDSEKSPDKVIYMNDIFRMKCNSSYALILSLKVNSFLHPWQQVPLPAALNHTFAEISGPGDWNFGLWRKCFLSWILGGTDSQKSLWGCVFIW